MYGRHDGWGVGIRIGKSKVEPVEGLCVVFLRKTLASHSVLIQPEVKLNRIRI